LRFDLRPHSIWSRRRTDLHARPHSVGITETVVAAVAAFKPGNHAPDFLHHGLRPLRLLPAGNAIDGTQAEYVRIPHADTSVYPVPAGADEEALVMLSDILPTGFGCGVLNGKVQPRASVVIVGAGPIGLAALLTAQFYSPADVITIDLDRQSAGGGGTLRGHKSRRQQ
jgi:alcohol dehydrogenase